MNTGKDRILVICIDRDDDIGRKAGVKGPIVGRQENIEAASKLLVADPGEADANSMFAAVKLRDELEKKAQAVEVATLTGDKFKGFTADRKISKQLEQVLEEFPADGCVFVTDGADDDTTLPVIQSQVKVMSKHTVKVKQAIELERTYYVIKEAIKDPTIGSVLLGIPGLVMFFYFLFGDEGIRLTLGLLGAYMVLKGFGIEAWVVNGATSFVRAISLQRLSFPFYIGTMIFFAFFLMAFVGTYLNEAGQPIQRQLSQSILNSVSFLAFTGLSFIFGRLVDVHFLNLGYNLKKYTQYMVSVLVLWYVVTATVNTALGREDLFSLVFSLAIGAVAIEATLQVSKVFEVQLKAGEKPEGTPVFDSDGRKIGELVKTSAKDETATIKPLKGKTYELPLESLTPRIEGVTRLG